MKTVKYANGREHGTTMTVAELITKLQEFQSDLPILPTWEGIHTVLRPDGVRLIEYHGQAALQFFVDQWQ